MEKYNFVKESVISAMDKALERVLENEVIDLSKCDGNYLNVKRLNIITIIEYGTIMLEIININKYYLQ